MLLRYMKSILSCWKNRVLLLKISDVEKEVNAVICSLLLFYFKEIYITGKHVIIHNK